MLGRHRAGEKGQQLGSLRCRVVESARGAVRCCHRSVSRPLAEPAVHVFHAASSPGSLPSGVVGLWSRGSGSGRPGSGSALVRKHLSTLNNAGARYMRRHPRDSDESACRRTGSARSDDSGNSPQRHERRRRNASRELARVGSCTWLYISRFIRSLSRNEEERGG